MRRSTAAMALAAALAAGRVHAGSPPSPASGELQRAPLSLVVNLVPRGEITALVGPADVLVEVAALAAVGVHPPAGMGRREDHEGRSYLALASLEGRARYEIDGEGAVLRLIVDPSWLAASTLDLADARRPRSLEISRRPSGFLNYAVRSADAGRLHGFSEVGLSAGDALLVSGGSIDQRGHAMRGLSQLSIALSSALSRLTLGDFFASSGPLGGSALLGGIHLGRSFELDPYLVTLPALSTSGIATTPSTVEVWMNGALVRRAEVAPGPFQIANLPATTGLGSARTVVRDAFGREQESTTNYYLPGGLLGPGLSDYAISVGWRREDATTESFRYGEPALLVRQRIGLTASVTGGIRLEVAPDLVSGGAGATVRLPLGEIQIAGASSTSDGLAGTAGLASYGLITGMLSVSAFVRGQDSHYAALGLSPLDDRPLFEVGASLGAPIGRRVSLGLQGILAEKRDEGSLRRLGASAAVRLHDGVGLTVNSAHTETEVGTVFETFASLAISLTGRSTASLSADQRGDRMGASIDLSRPLPAGPGVGLRLHGAEGEHRRALGVAQAQGRYARATATAEAIDGRFAHSVELAGALLTAGGRVTASRPVQQGFAMVEVPSTPGVRISVDNRPAGSTDRRGLLAVPDLLPYYGNRIAIADNDLPLDRTTGTGERLIAPTLRGGVLVSFGVELQRTLRGRLRIMTASGETTPAFGELSVALPAAGISSPIGAEGEFEIEGASAGVHQATVTWSGGTCPFPMVVPAVAAGVTEMGDIRCRTAPEEK